MVVAFSSLVTIPKQVSAYIPHDPIRIYSDAEFTPANGVTGGNGTITDPYIIEGWEIVGAGFENGIVIKDTTAHFTIRNVSLRSGDIEPTVSIDLDNVFNATVTDSIIGGYGYCLSLGPGANISIVDNRIYGAWWWGISGWDLDNLTFKGNSVSGRIGAMYIGQSTNLTFNFNDFSAGLDGGIRFSENNHTDFSWNSVRDAFQYGLELVNSTNTALHHNSFISDWTVTQALDDMGPENIWDDGYPSGGNYWSDYNGTDDMSGPNQDIPGSDGIGDMPYVIDADSQDNYPLMSPPSPPLPGPPSWIRARLSGLNGEDVTVLWHLSQDDGKRYKTVVGYEIYRNTSFDQDGLGYQFVGFVPNGTAEFTDVSAGEGDSNIYFYFICAVDAGGNASCAEQVIKYTRPLTKGMNLVSFPVSVTNNSAESVLQTVKYDRVWTREWDWITTSYSWAKSSTEKPWEEELQIGWRQGIWVNVTEDSNLTVAGGFPWSEISLRVGWNLVGFPSFNTTYTIADLKAAGNVTRVEGFDPNAPPYYLKLLGDAEFLRTGYGYWILSTSSRTVDIPLV